MQSARKQRVSPSMAVALTALVFAVAGSAFAAGSAFQDADGVVQGCVARANLVTPLTDGVDAITKAPVSGLTQAVTPKGSVIVVAPGATCPKGYEPQSLGAGGAAQLPEVFATSNPKPQHLGRDKSEVVKGMLPAGSFLVTGAVDIVAEKAVSVVQTVKCTFTDSDGKAIPGTTSTTTIPADSPGARITLPMTAALRDHAAGALGIQCKGVLPKAQAAAAKATGARAAHDVNGPIPGMNADGSFEATESKYPEPICTTTIYTQDCRQPGPGEG